MPSDSSNPGDPNKQRLISALGNPHAPEEDWINASQALGEVNEQKSNSERRRQEKRLLAESGILAAVGIAVFGIFSLTNTAHKTPTAVPNPPPTTVSPAPTAKAETEVNFGPYMANVQRKIKRNWHPPKKNLTNRTSVMFDLASDGTLSNLKLNHSSGVAAVDKAALDAVNDAAREFGALPKGASDKVSIQFTFDYNVFNGHSNSTTRDGVPPFSAN